MELLPKFDNTEPMFYHRMYTIVLEVTTMPKEPTPTPNLHVSQLVGIIFLNEQGQPKNDLALKCDPYYFAKFGEIKGWTSRSINGQTEIVYFVKMDDGAVLKLTEDCLIKVKSHIDHRK
jgi:hypothetical protein